MTLLSRLQDAPVGTRELDIELMCLLGGARHIGEGLFYGPNEAVWHTSEAAEDDGSFHMLPSPSRSIDAALALAERVLPPEWTWRVERNGFGYFAAFWSDPEYAPEGEAIASTPALALCAAIIAAKEAGE